MLKRTPVIAVAFGCLIFFAVKYLVEDGARPFSAAHIAVLSVICYVIGLGIAMLFDPKAAETKKKYLKINFYKE